MSALRIWAARQWGKRYPRSYYALWAARSISVLGDYIALMALTLYAARQPNAPFAVSALFLAQTIPWLLSPLAGALADRIAPRRLALACNLGQAILVGVLALATTPFTITLILVGAVSLLEVCFLPVGQSALPVIVAPAELSDANALLRLGLNISRAAGPLAVAALLCIIGLRGTLLADAMSFVLAAALLLSLPTQAPARELAERPLQKNGRFSRLGAELRQGLAFVIHTAVPRAVALGLFLATLFVALDNVALVFLAQRTLHGGPVGYGALLAGYGAGMIAAPLLLILVSRRLTTQINLLIGVTVMGLGTALCALSPTLGLAVAAEVVVGIGNGFQNITNDTLLQKTTPPALLGRIFGVAYSAPYLALLITYTVGGTLIQATSPRIALLIAGLGTMAVTAIIWGQLQAPQRT